MPARKCTCEPRRETIAVGCPVHGERKRYRKRADGSYEIIPAAELACKEHGRTLRIVRLKDEHKPRYVCATCKFPVVE
jgi:hypothetical protein